MFLIRVEDYRVYIRPQKNTDAYHVFVEVANNIWFSFKKMKQVFPIEEVYKLEILVDKHIKEGNLIRVK